MGPRCEHLPLASSTAYSARRPRLAVPGVSIYARADGGGFSRLTVESKIPASRCLDWHCTIGSDAHGRPAAPNTP
ncbi:hypothetical protein FKP32DRAFT_1596425 [Trametes sanguinea]|nr:hypothetical protein FKP32DRAFT_1596425 [Trametes sanguinea]